MSKEDTQREYAQGRESRVPRTTPKYTENTRQVHRLDDIIPEQVRAKITQASIYEGFVQKKDGASQEGRTSAAVTTTPRGKSTKKLLTTRVSER